MSIYEEFGVRAIISVSGSSTRVGGALMPAEVVEAMSEAALESVSMVELQAAASRRIRMATGAEAGYVTSGAAAGLTLGAAAILAGLDPARMGHLPDTRGMKNEFIIAREQRSGYDHAIRLAGASLVEVGMNEYGAGAGVRRTELWEYEAAVGERTAGVAYVAGPDSRPPLRAVVELAHRHGLPVLVDAAAQLPPVENLRAFVETGADLIAFSGGKAIRGPQSTGILCGRADLIASVALQHMDMDESFDIWDPPEDLIPKSAIAGIPRHGIGRGFKVAKEQVIGLLMALKLFSEGRYEPYLEEQRRHLEYIADGLSGLPVELRVVERPGGAPPLLHVALDARALGKGGFEVSRELKRGTPGVFVNENLLFEDTLVIDPLNLDQARTEALTRRLREVLSGAG